MIPRALLLRGSFAVLAGAALLFTPLPASEAGAAGSSLGARLVGPIAALVASAQWVRADLAFRAGRVELFLARAHTALQLAPESAEGWRYLAWHQAYALASPEREADPERRLAWVRAGLATAAQGERVAKHPEELALLGGLILIKLPMVDPQLPWPGGMAAAWEAAAEHFERARRLGYDAEDAADLSRLAREAAAELRAQH